MAKNPRTWRRPGRFTSVSPTAPTGIRHKKHHRRIRVPVFLGSVAVRNDRIEHIASLGKNGRKKPASGPVGISGRREIIRKNASPSSLACNTMPSGESGGSVNSGHGDNKDNNIQQHNKLLRLIWTRYSAFGGQETTELTLELSPKGSVSKPTVSSRCVTMCDAESVHNEPTNKTASQLRRWSFDLPFAPFLYRFPGQLDSRERLLTEVERWWRQRRAAAGKAITRFRIGHAVVEADVLLFVSHANSRTLPKQLINCAIRQAGAGAMVLSGRTFRRLALISRRKTWASPSRDDKQSRLISSRKESRRRRIWHPACALPLNAPPSARNYALPARYRSGEDGRSSVPDRSAIPASAPPSRRFSAQRTSR